MSDCECGKTRYLSRGNARQAARRASGEARSLGKLRAYRCHGGFWHLTTKGPAYAMFYRRRES